VDGRSLVLQILLTLFQLSGFVASGGRLLEIREFSG